MFQINNTFPVSAKSATFCHIFMCCLAIVCHMPSNNPCPSCGVSTWCCICPEWD